MCEDGETCVVVGSGVGEDGHKCEPCISGKGPFTYIRRVYITMLDMKTVRFDTYIVQYQHIC